MRPTQRCGGGRVAHTEDRKSHPEVQEGSEGPP